MKKLSVVFFGTPAFAIPPLKAILRSGYIIKAVVTNPKKPHAISPSPVELWAEENCLQISYDASDVPDADFFVIAAYGKIIQKEILDKPKYGTLNVHPSLLPRYRGPSPIASAILSGDRKTGVTIMLTDTKMDHGPILEQKKIMLDGSETTAALTEKLADVGAELLAETMQRWAAGKIHAREQNHAEATFSKIIKKEDGLIDWQEPAETIERKIRAYNPWPLAWSTFVRNSKKMRINIIEARRVFEASAGKNPGRAEIRHKRLFVYTGDELLEITKIQPESRALMTGEEFARGFLRRDESGVFI